METILQYSFAHLDVPSGKGFCLAFAWMQVSHCKMAMVGLDFMPVTMPDSLLSKGICG
jgi:hypothetical protein